MHWHHNLKMKGAFSMKFFNFDNPVMQALTKLADLFILNLLFTLCCIPVVTIGASLTALYTVTLKAAKNEESYIVSNFFRAFKENFKISTLSWLIMLAARIVLFLDFRFSAFLPVSYSQVIRVAAVSFSIIYFLLMTYLFPYIARFENTLKNSFKNAFILSIIHLPYTFLFLIIALLSIALTIFINFQISGFLWFVIGFSGIAYVNSLFFRKIFSKYE